MSDYEELEKNEYKTRFHILRCAHPHLNIPDDDLTLQEYRDRYLELVNEITRSEKEKRHQELKVYIDAIFPLIDERLTFKRWSINSSDIKSLPELKAVTRDDWKTRISSIPEFGLLPGAGMGLEIFFMDQITDLCYILTNHIFDKMIADGYQYIEDIEDHSIYDEECRILTKYLLLSMLVLDHPMYDDIYKHPYTKAFQEIHGAYEAPPQRECVIL